MKEEYAENMKIPTAISRSLTTCPCKKAALNSLFSISCSKSGYICVELSPKSEGVALVKLGKSTLLLKYLTFIKVCSLHRILFLLQGTSLGPPSTPVIAATSTPAPSPPS